MASSRVDMPGISSVTLCRLGEEADVQDVSNQNAKRRRAHLEFNIADISPPPRWPRQWETKDDPHAAGRFTRSVAIHSTLGAATLRATARCPLPSATIFH